MNIAYLSKATNYFSLFPILAICILYVGCAGSSKSRLPDLSQLQPGDVEHKIARNFAKLQTFTGQARVMIELPGAGYNGFSSVNIIMPDSVYVKTEAILGIDIGDLFVDAKHFAAYAPRENVLYYGERELLDLRSFLEVEIATDELFELFTGLTQIVVDSSSRLSFDDGKLLIESTQDEYTVKSWIDSERYVVEKSQLVENDGTVVLQKEFRRFRKKDNLYIPQIIKLFRPRDRERITVYYTSVKVNKSVSPEKFKLKPSANARKVYWGDVSNIKVDRKSLNSQ